MKNTTHSPRRYVSASWARVSKASCRGLLEDFSRHLREVARPLQIAYQQLMAAFDGKPIGVECRMKDRQSWAFVLPHASGERAWRIQQFDMDGFVGHLCFDSLEEAVEEMLRMGYCMADRGALDRIASTGRWTRGVRRSAVMQRHQEGLITYRQMIEETAALPD